MKEALKEEIGVWKENLKAVIYLFVIDLTGTVARAVKYGVFDIWVLGGLLALLAIAFAYILVWKRISRLLQMLREVDSG